MKVAKSLEELLTNSDILERCKGKPVTFTPRESNPVIKSSVIKPKEDWVVAACKHKGFNGMVEKIAKKLWPNATSISISISTNYYSKDGKLSDCNITILIY